MMILFLKEKKNTFSIPTALESKAVRQLMAVLLEFPFSIVQRADLTSFQPPWNAMEVESMLK